MKNYWKRHYMSRHEYPTKVIKGDGRGNSGGVAVGHVRARRDLESKLRRSLREGTTVDTCGGNWRFTEPKKVA